MAAGWSPAGAKAEQISKGMTLTPPPSPKTGAFHKGCLLLRRPGTRSTSRRTSRGPKSHTVQPTLITVAPAEELTLITFFKKMADTLDPAERLVLNHLMRALTERGWLPRVKDLITGLEARGEAGDAVEVALGRLIHKRLVTLDPEGQEITTLVGGLSAARTPHRAHLDSGVNLFTHGGVELLALHNLLAQPVEGSTTCGHCSHPITFRMEAGALCSLTPNGAAAYQANWDGEGPIETVYTTSNLFCSDACMSTWSEAHSELEGLPIAGDLLLHVGVMMAGESGDARFAMFGMQD